MIDGHVHCRDWGEAYKETIAHALDVAERARLSAIFDQPNTNPPIISREIVVLRLSEAERCYSPVIYATHVGITSDPVQIEEAVGCEREFSLREQMKNGKRIGVSGLKMFAGRSVGDLSVTDPEKQLEVYRTLTRLGYEGVLVVHCEKESRISSYFDPNNPITHYFSRPQEAEIESVEDQIKFAIETGYKGRLHIAHVSSPVSVEIINDARSKIRISCGATPHHLLLSTDLMQYQQGVEYKVNPPIRDEKTRARLFRKFLEGKIDALESDHAPHSYDEKFSGKYLSGIPWLPWWPEVIAELRKRGASEGLLDAMTHNNQNMIYGLNIPKMEFRGKLIEGDDKDFYAFDPLKSLRS